MASWRTREAHESRVGGTKARTSIEVKEETKKRVAGHEARIQDCFRGLDFGWLAGNRRQSRLEKGLEDECDCDPTDYVV